MLKIRLKKTGRKRINTFRVVVINDRFSRDSGRSISDLGYYFPQQKLVYLMLNLQKYHQWINNGAKPTKRVIKLYNIAKNNNQYVIKS